MTDEQILRRLLWLRHGCRSPMLYGDDGEMQCNHCLIDFKRLPAAQIEEIFYQRTMQALQHKQALRD